MVGRHRVEQLIAAALGGADFDDQIDIGAFLRYTPEDYGAKRDGTPLSDVDMTSSSGVLSASDGAFTSADVGKTVAVYGAGSVGAGTVLVSTIASVQSGTQVTLAATATNTVTGTRAVYGTDDTDAIQDAVDAVFAASVAAGSHYGEVIFSPGIYVVAGPAQLGAPYYGNAQIRIPVVTETATKFTLVLRGGWASATFCHWNQETPQRSGAVLYSTLVAATSDGTYGAAAIVGGPSRADQGGGFSAGFSNMLLVVEGLTIMAQRNPSVTGLHAGRIAQVHVKSLGVLADMTPTEMHDHPATNDLGLAVRFPNIGNNHYARVDDLAVEGFYYGATLTDHFTAIRMVFVYVNTAIFINGGGAAEHGISILNLGVEGSVTILEASFSSGGRMPIDIAQCNVEIMTGTGFIDTNNALVGYVGYTSNTVSVPTVSGANNLTLINLNRRPGLISGPDTPAIPSTTVALTNPLWRHCNILIAGGTVTQVAIDGQNTGITEGWFPLPTGSTITLTYSSPPTWTWWAQ